jgi:hypothetical protein
LPERRWPPSYSTSAIAGFADAHATAASATKAVLAFTSGTRKFAWEVSLGLILVLAST